MASPLPILREGTDVAAKLLTAAFGTSVNLEPAEIIADYPKSVNIIFRCRLNSEHPKLPESVVVKCAKEAIGRLRTELIGLKFLAEVPGLRTMPPTLYAHDLERDLLVMEDLGSDKVYQLGRILLGNDSRRARQALLNFQRALASLHAESLGYADQFTTLKDQLKPQITSAHRIHSILTILAGFPAQVDSWNLPRNTALHAEVRRACRLIANPGPFLGFTHGDCTPANVFCTPHSIRMYDFECCDFRHVLLDGSFARLRYLHSVWALRIPPTLRRELDTAYRLELAAAAPLAIDTDKYEESLIACAMGWLAGLCQMLPKVMEQDQKWGRCTWRQRICAGLSHLQELCADYNRFPGLAEWAHLMLQALPAHWGKSALEMPVYPALDKMDEE